MKTKSLIKKNTKITTKKLFGYIFIVIFVLLSLVVSFSLGSNDDLAPGESEASTHENTYIIWSINSSSPWVYNDSTKKRGIVLFPEYESDLDFERLEDDFDGMITQHKPELLIYLPDTRELQPLIEIDPPMIDIQSESQLPVADLTLDCFRVFVKLS